ncbi:hypothetical protein [Frigidibacter sp.]|uniref:hypothetical protein n=1 Tax=Frigidibacter sp. TaxID=2586418 RepID=UPI00273404A5|nr:hypothetical protein [Frigidibacter sp.]MDP3341214.1 hypothetical protein [Frigidibacter sp.]
MKRRFLLTTLLALALCPTAALSQSMADRIAGELRAEGFSEVSTARTLLGRARIYAKGPAGTREIILDPRTGEILRDLWISPDGAPTNPFTASGGDGSRDRSSGSGSSGSGSSGGSSEEDDDDDDDDRDDDDDDDRGDDRGRDRDDDAGDDDD